MIKKAIAAGILTGLVIFAIYSQMDKNDNPESAEASKIRVGTEVGSVAPAFSLKDLDGQKVSLDDYKGKPVLLNFWATWCPPCKAEMPDIEKLHEEHSSEIEILSINLDPENDVSGFVSEYGLTFPVLLDQIGVVQQTYSIISIPTTLVINEEGVIMKKQVGSMSYDQMEEIIQ